MRCHENGCSRGTRNDQWKPPWGAANTGRIRKERNSASGRSRGTPNIKILSRGRPEITGMTRSKKRRLAVQTSNARRRHTGDFGHSHVHSVCKQPLDSVLPQF